MSCFSILFVRDEGRLTPGEDNVPHGYSEGVGSRCEFLKYPFLWSGSIGSPLGFPELEQPPKIKMVERGKTSWSCLSPPSVREVENQVSGETDTPFAVSCLGPAAGFAAEAPVKVPQGGPSPWDASLPAHG